MSEHSIILKIKHFTLGLLFMSLLVSTTAHATLLDGVWQSAKGEVLVFEDNRWRYFEDGNLIDEGSFIIADIQIRATSRITGEELRYRYELRDNTLTLTDLVSNESTTYQRRPREEAAMSSREEASESGSRHSTSAAAAESSAPVVSENGGVANGSMAIINGNEDEASHFDVFAAVDEILSHMESANIAFNTPNNIYLKQTAIVELLLSLTQSINELADRIEQEGGREGAVVSVSNIMEARLTGPNFEITTITPEQQIISRSDVTQWKWEVKPITEGTHHLHLTLTAIIKVEGAPTTRAIRTFDKEITVEVTMGQKIEGFISSNWQWLWAAIVVPIAGWYLKKKKPKSA